MAVAENEIAWTILKELTKQYLPLIPHLADHCYPYTWWTVTNAGKIQRLAVAFADNGLQIRMLHSKISTHHSPSAFNLRISFARLLLR